MGWNLGVMEYWSDGLETQRSTTPSLHSRALHVDDDDTLGFEIIIQRFRPMFSADAAGLNAAKRKLIIAVMKRVYPYISRLKLLDGFIGVQQISRPDRRSEAEFRRIGFLQCFIEGFECIGR